MARGGFLGRIGRAIRNIVAPPPSPPQPPKRPPPEEPPPEPTNRDYKRAWRDEGGKGSYRKHLNVFHNLVDPVEPDPEEQLMLWESYVRNMVRGGRTRRQSPNNPFWRESGIHPSEFNWANWRIAMGYTGTRRSRT